MNDFSVLISLKQFESFSILTTDINIHPEQPLTGYFTLSELSKSYCRDGCAGKHLKKHTNLKSLKSSFFPFLNLKLWQVVSAVLVTHTRNELLKLNRYTVPNKVAGVFTLYISLRL